MASVILRLIVIAALPLVMFPPKAGAQIVNTLRGFQNDRLDWSGGLEGTVAAAGGNSDYSEFQLDGNVQYVSGRNRWRGLGGASQRRASGKSVAEDQLVHVRHNYRFTDRVASLMFTQWAHDRFLRLETRILLGAGGRLDLIRKENIEAAIGLAYMYEHEDDGPLPGDAPPGTFDDSGVEHENRLSLFVSVYNGSSEKVQSDVVLFWQPLVSALDKARTFVTASVRVNVKGGLYFLFRYRLSQDSDPPATVLARDQTVRSGLGIQF
jgi:hypothetical protein